MRVGIYDPYLDDIGGGEKYMMTAASCLSKEHNVSVFWDSQKDLSVIAERFSIDLSRVSCIPNIFTRKYSAFKRLSETKNFDVIIVLSDGSIPLIGARKFFIHIQQPLENLQTNSLLGKIKLFRKTVFFCNSQYTKSFLAKKSGIKVKVIYPPVSLFPEKVAKENIILHVGRFRSVNGTDYKKQSVMIRAFKQMVDNGLKNWKFVVATSVHEKDMDTFKEMEKLAASYPISFLINNSNKALWNTYNKAKIYWHASGFGEDLEQYPELAEHFGISTVEAMGAGAVPVVINAGGQKEIVQDGENGLLWNTLEELEKKTLDLTQNTKLWTNLSENAEKTAQNFSGDRFCREIGELVTG